MKCKIKYLHSPDALDLLSFIPEEPDNFGLLIQMIISPLETDGEESFDFLLCSPKYLENLIKEESVIFGRHFIFMNKYDYVSLYHKLNEYVSNVEFKTWDEIGNYLSRIGKWEFEDYKP